jgi:hypothetical protein
MQSKHFMRIVTAMVLLIIDSRSRAKVACPIHVIDRINGKGYKSVSEKYLMKVEKPLEELADMLSSVIKGGSIMSKVLDDRHILPNQLMHYRSYIRLVFGDA